MLSGHSVGMTLVHRVLPPSPSVSLTHYRRRGGGKGLEAARRVEPEVLIAELEASGLRGRGGAGFPTGRKWRTIASYRSELLPTTVVVNAAEGEPGTYKDRTILMLNPYAVLEGALIAARAVGADSVVVATKQRFTDVLERVRSAIAEVQAAGWCDGVELRVVEGPHEYLFGEETALLEVVDGRYPFPRIAPPWRRGVVEVVEDDVDAISGSGQSAHVEMAGATDAPPALASNVETFANVPRIIARGAAWYRTEGTERSPGTVVCTITGDTQRAGVGEVIMGTPLGTAIEAIGEGMPLGRQLKAVLSGVSNRVLGLEGVNTPLSYEDLAAAGGGLGSAGFLVFDDTRDMTAVAAGVARFLAIESCGQCTHCKQDGLSLAEGLERLCRNDGGRRVLDGIRKRLTTVADGARCNLATQQQVVVGSILERFGADVEAHADGRATPVAPMLIAELVSIEEGQALFDERHAAKQPDWTYNATDSGQAPADRLGEHREPEAIE